MGQDFTIQDASGNDVFMVDGKVFSIGDKLSFMDKSGNELASIRQKLLSFMPCYEIHKGQELFARVDKKMSFFKDKFEVDIPGPNDYSIKGSFLDHEYTFERFGKVVASVSKKYFSWSDTYGIDIIDNEDDITILASAVVIDLVCHDNKNN